MKLAVLSDIHGNNFALNAVIADFQKEKVDDILILGDLITDFAQSTRAILETVKSLDAHVIKGNREGYMIGNSNGDYGNSWIEHKQFSTNLSTYRLLQKDDIAYLKSLPSQLSLTYGTMALRMVHGSPFSEFDILLENKDELIQKSLHAIDEKILVCGHTHRQILKHFGNKTILNPGSVGLNFIKENSAQYAIIEQKNDEIIYHMKKVPYDYEAFKRTCDTNNFWVRLCLRSMEDGNNYNMRFLDEAEKRYHTWLIPNDSFDELANEWIDKGIV